MNNFHIAPFVTEIFGDQPSMAVLRCDLAAETAATINQILVDQILNAT